MASELKPSIVEIPRKVYDFDRLDETERTLTAFETKPRIVGILL